MPGYKHPCRYCEALIDKDSNVCPICGKDNPATPIRCPRCRTPIRKSWQRCNVCGLKLNIECPFCGKETFFDSYCEHCDKRLLVVCPRRRCKTKQPPISENCIKCGKPLER